MWSTTGESTTTPDIDPLSDGAVRVGWDEMSDLQVVDATRDAFRSAVVSAYPDEQSSNAASAGTLYRFVHEIAEGGIIVSPNLADGPCGSAGCPVRTSIGRRRRTTTGGRSNG